MIWILDLSQASHWEVKLNLPNDLSVAGALHKEEFWIVYPKIRVIEGNSNWNKCPNPMPTRHQQPEKISTSTGTAKPCRSESQNKKEEENKRGRRKVKGHATVIGPSLVAISLTRRWGAAAQPWTEQKTGQMGSEGRLGFFFSLEGSPQP